jgi:Uma2 family endonuclease
VSAREGNSIFVLYLGVKLENSGALTYRYELVEGDILPKMGQKLPHGIGVNRLTAYCFSVFGADYTLSQTTIDVFPEDNPTSEPEPDICVLNIPLAELFENPAPTQIRLLIEVSDTTLRFDLTTKASLYARAGIVEYWVLDLNNRKLIVHRDPVRGVYSSIMDYPETASVAPLSTPISPVLVATLLPSP